MNRTGPTLSRAAAAAAAATRRLAASAPAPVSVSVSVPVQVSTPPTPPKLAAPSKAPAGPQAAPAAPPRAAPPNPASANTSAGATAAPASDMDALSHLRPGRRKAAPAPAPCDTRPPLDGARPALASTGRRVFIHQAPSRRLLCLLGLLGLLGLLVAPLRPLTAECRLVGELEAQPRARLGRGRQLPASTSAAAHASSTGQLARLQSTAAPDVDAFAYLQRYGYVNTSLANANLMSEESFHEAVMSFQRFAGIPETGQVDGQTIRFMQMPRCGNKDRSGKPGGEGGRRKRRRKRYALQGSKWRRQELSYRISQYPSRFVHKKQDVDGQIERAFKIWSQVAPIDFVVKKEGRVHIDIRFASGEHGDGDPFDGPGNTLAHAYFPQYGGDAHFDDQEYWTVDSYAGTNIFQVAAHELGHSLGLGHSSVREALMAPFYQKYKPNFKLHADDVLAIQALYGEKAAGGGPDGASDEASSSTSTTTPSSSSSPPASSSERPSGRRPIAPGSRSNDDDPNPDDRPKPDLCQDSSIDAITRTEDGSTYVFKGQHYWLVKNEGLAAGYPARISRDWDGLPGNLDAALTWSDGKTFFFKGDKYWRFFNKRREPGYPKLISAGFAGIPNNIDAAFVWSGNGKTYFFKRDKYWRFDSKQEPPVSSQYPKSIKNWTGLPASGISDAFKWENGMTYFFKDDQYFRFDDREFEVDTSARPAFPRSTGEWWFGCTNSNLPIRAAAADSDAADQPTAASSLQLFHRKPGFLFDTLPSETTAATPAANRAPQRPAGSSLSRSFLSSLSDLFSSSSSSSSSSPSSSSSSSQTAPDTPTARSMSANKDDTDDWSFHRGLSEEVRRLLRNQPAPVSPTSGRPASSSPFGANTRWHFPLASSDESRRRR